jgi:hypothetical protein
MTAYGRVQISRFVWRFTAQRRVSSRSVHAASWTENLFIPASTTELWRSARRLSR